MGRTTLTWFRRDLRLAENPALATAAAAGTVAPLFVMPAEDARHAPGPASRAWLTASLAALTSDLEARGSSLAIREGDATTVVLAAARECGATHVTCTRNWSPLALAEEHAVADALARAGIAFEVSEAQLLAPPSGMRDSGGGSGPRVFSAFFRRWRAAWAPDAALLAPERLLAPARPLAAGPRQRDGGEPAARGQVAGGAGPEGAGGAGDGVLAAGGWRPGEAGARERLTRFASERLGAYAEAREYPAVPATSELSPHLAWGEVSPRAAARAVLESASADPRLDPEPFLRQLAWREFAYHVTAANPHTLDEPLRAEFSAFPWRGDAADLAAWRAGHTGFPLVDAGMRQLAQTGWMHNRVRMVVASLLTKDLLIRWQAGEVVFAELLVDYDPVLNAFNWQWVAGSGADAAPYFRIFNPTVQGQRFDARGEYVKRWVPELSALDARWVQRPWDAPPSALAAAGVTLGRDYPEWLVDHAEARKRALAAFSAMRATGPS